MSTYKTDGHELVTLINKYKSNRISNTEQHRMLSILDTGIYQKIHFSQLYEKEDIYNAYWLGVFKAINKGRYYSSLFKKQCGVDLRKPETVKSFLTLAGYNHARKFVRESYKTIMIKQCSKCGHIYQYTNSHQYSQNCQKCRGKLEVLSIAQSITDKECLIADDKNFVDAIDNTIPFDFFAEYVKYDEDMSTVYDLCKETSLSGKAINEKECIDIIVDALNENLSIEEIPISRNSVKKIVAKTKKIYRMING